MYIFVCVSIYSVIFLNFNRTVVFLYNNTQEGYVNNIKVKFIVEKKIKKMTIKKSNNVNCVFAVCLFTKQKESKPMFGLLKA